MKKKMTATREQTMNRSASRKVTVFWEEGFPAADTVPPTQDSLARALADYEVRFADAGSLGRALEDSDLLVMPYGSAFPKPAWLAICDYLRRGGNWLNLGGNLFSRPVRLDAGAWQIELPQRAYAKELLINHGFATDLPDGTALVSAAEEVSLADIAGQLDIARAWALQVRLSDTGPKDFPNELGTAGRRDGIVRPLLRAVVDGRVIAVPIIAVDRLAGPCRGGRWVLLNACGKKAFPPDLVGRLAAYALVPQVELEVSPSFACYYGGEQASITLQAVSEPLELTVTLDVSQGGHEVHASRFDMVVGKGPAILTVPPLPLCGSGLHVVRATARRRGDLSGAPLATALNGFWVYDEGLLARTGRLSVNRDYFIRDGQTVPITGTTYMSGDKHRKFLFEPNAAVWDADFAAMREAGVNMVRTGFWTGWKKIMCDRGAVDEGVQRAFAAFLLSAARHELTVILNLFAFMPEEWGGEHPYIDPDSLRSQRAFVAAFAHRFAGANNLMYDFINEPSFSPKQAWSVLPNHDRHEQAAWTTWLQERGVSGDEWATRWRRTPRNAMALPQQADFNDADIFQGKQPVGTLEFKLFAQEMFARWCRQLGAVIRENGNPHQLLTVGQDEGGTGSRPNPWFHGPSVDFTCNHPWWMNDFILLNSLITKTPDRPNLLQELGIMFLENVDGSARRSLDDCAALLERKMALSFAGGCAGFIQWLWNTNVYMDSDNEVGIGFLHADGSEKPELEAFRGVAEFFRKAAPHMTERRVEEICIVIPHSLMFSVRDQAFDAVERAIRVLEYRLGLPCRTIAEHRIAEIGKARLIVLPSARVLSDECWATLLARVEEGATLLTTGFIEADPWWRPAGRLAPFGLHTKPVLLGHEESVANGQGGQMSFTFFGLPRHKVDKAVDDATGGEIGLQVLSHGKGQIVYCPLPAELAQSEQQTESLYRIAAAEAGLSCRSNASPGVLVRPVEFERATLYLIVNESGSVQNVKVGPETGMQEGVSVAGGRAAMVMMGRASGKTLARYPSGLKKS